MSQDSMNIALPEAMKEFVQEQVSTGGYSTASEYVRELIRADQKRKAQERLEKQLLDGLESPAAPLTANDWAHIRAEVRRRSEKKS